MMSNKCANIETRQNVTIENQYGFIGGTLQIWQCVSNRTTCTQRLVLGGDHYFDAQISTIDELLKNVSAIRGSQHDPSDPGVSSAGDLVHGERHPGHGEHGLGRVDGERAQSGALTPYQQDGFGHGASVPQPPEYVDQVANPVWDLLTKRRLESGAAPAVTFIGSTRTELSSTSLENAVAKLSGALRDEWSLEPGDQIAAYLPWHWQRVVWSLAAWSLGVSLDVEGKPATAALTVCGPAGIAAALEAGCEEPVVVSLHPFGLPITDLPPNCTDAASVIRLQPDSFYAEPVSGEATALILGGQQSSISDLINGAKLGLAKLGLTQNDRLLISNLRHDDLDGYLLAPLAPLLGVGSVVITDGPLNRESVISQEGVTAVWERQ